MRKKTDTRRIAQEFSSVVQPVKSPLNWRNILWLFGSLAVMIVGVPIALWAWGVTKLSLALFLMIRSD